MGFERIRESNISEEDIWAKRIRKFEYWIIEESSEKMIWKLDSN